MSSFSPADEDAFLWEEDVCAASAIPVGPAPLSEAEKMAVRLCVDVTLQSAFALEDPNERYGQLFGRTQKTHLPSKAPAGKEVGSDELTNNLYEMKLQGGVVGFEVNPPDAPALSRSVLIGGRVALVVSKLFLAFERATLFQAYELSPLKMTEPVDPATAGNRFFRLVSDPTRKMAHDVACLLAWMTLEDGTDMLEMSAWPVEKV